jgi:hypothetical protein
VRVLPIDPADEADLAEFLDLPRRLQGADPGWIAPLRQPLVAELTGRSAFSRYGRQRLWLCEDGGRVVGRLAALVNPRLGGIGQVGYFECEDDLDACRALLDAASAWLRAQGQRELVGPMNGGAHRLHRLLVAGFDRPPFLFEPRNPPWYPRLFEASGLARVHTWATYELAGQELERLHARLARAAQRASDEHRCLPLDPADPATLVRVHALLDRVWAGHTGYASLDLDDVKEALAGLLPLVSVRTFGAVVDRDGKDVGLGFMFPDWAREVRALDGDATGWGRWLGGPRPAGLIMHTFAFAPEARGSGAPHKLFEHAARHMLEDGHTSLILALATEELRVLRRYGAPTREYALYGRPL